MKFAALASLLFLASFPASMVFAHCEVPCGIYGDQRRFEDMLEDQETIAKSIASINEMLPDLGSSALGINQAARWVSTKEDHATKIQHTIAQYFMTQRIKPDNERYQDQLNSAHAVMVAAMKCKQTADPATATALREAIMKFYQAYEGQPMPQK